MTVGIYCYYDDVKHRVAYVGKDSNIDKNRRHRQHYYPSNKDEQEINKVLQNDLENNNINRYTYVVLERSDDWTNEDLNEKEKYYISLFDPKFNFTEGGDGAGSGESHYMYGKKHKEETRKKISEAHKGKKIPEETRKKISETMSGENHPMYGKKRLEETRKKISETLKGKKHSEESKKKMSEAHKGKKIPEETRKKISEAHKGKKILEETRKKISEALSGENNPQWKDYARVVKAGFKNGKQNYALKQNGKTITTSIYKEKLEKEAEERNKKQDKQK